MFSDHHTQIKEVFDYLLNVDQTLEGLDGPKALRLAKTYASSLSDTQEERYEDSFEGLDEDFQAQVEWLICDPKLKALGRAMYELMKDSCNSFTQMRPGTEKLVSLLDLTCSTWTENVMHEKASLEDTTQTKWPLDYLESVWKEVTQESQAQQWIDGIVCLSVVLNYIIGNSDAFVVDLYSSWLTLLLSQRVGENYPPYLNESIALHLSLPISTLILSSAVYDKGDGSERIEVTQHLFPLKRLFANKLALRALFCDENGTDFLKRLIDRVSYLTRKEEQENLESLLNTLFDTCSQIGHCIQSQPRLVYGLDKVYWFNAWAPGSPLMMTPLMLVAHLVLKIILNAAAGSVRPGIVVSANLRNIRQQAAFAIFKGLLQNCSVLLSGPQSLSAQIVLLEDEDTEGDCEDDVDSENAGDEQGHQEADCDGDETPRKPTKSRTSRKALRKQGYPKLLNASLDPVFSFLAQLILTAPEKRDLRDRLLVMVTNFLKDRSDSPHFSAFFIKFVMLMNKLTYAERASIRILALEMLTACIDTNDIIFRSMKTFGWIQHIYIARCSDISAQMRNRALELLSQFLSMVEARLQRIPSLLVWLQAQSAAETHQTLDGSGSASQQNSVDKSTETRDCENRFDLAAVLVVLNLRVLDEKSIVRKSCINLLLSVFSLLTKLEPSGLHPQIFTLVPKTLLTVLRDDSGLLVRQRFISFLSALFGMFEQCLEIRKFVVDCWLTLVMDSEESVANRARESFKSSILDAITNELRIFWKVQSKSEVADYDQFAIISLLTHLLAEGDAAERFIRVLTSLSHFYRSDTILLMRAICQEAPDPLPDLPQGLLRILNCCLVTLKLIDFPSGSKLSLGSSLVHYIHRKQLLSSNVDVDTLTLVLDILYKVLPYDSCLEAKQLLMDLIKESFQKLNCHPCLVGPMIKLYFILLPDSTTYKEEISRLVQTCRRHLSTLRSSQTSTSSDSTLHPTHAAVVMQIAGFCYVMASQVSSSNKTAQYLKEIAEPMATIMLSLASNAFKKYQAPNLTPYQGSEVTSNPQLVTSDSWIEDVPCWLRAIALASASQILLNHEGVAKRLISKLMEAGTSVAATRNDHGTTVSNLAFAGFDFALKMTSLMDPYFPLMSSFLANQSLSPFARLQILALLFQLTAQDFLKPRGLLTYHFLSALGDPDDHVRELAEQGVSSVLKPRVRDLVFTNFVELVCFSTGFYTHPTIKCALDVHPICSDMCDSKTLCVQNFNMSSNEYRRYQTYSAILSMASDQSKHLLTLKILSNFLAPFINSRNEMRADQTFPLPVDKSEPAGLALSDILRVLSCAELKLSFAQAQSRTNRDGTDEQPLGEDTEADKAEREVKAKEDRHITKEFLKQAVLPVLLSLRKGLQEAKSALQRDIYDCIASLLFEYRSELDDFVVDQHLMHLLKRSYDEGHSMVPATTMAQETETDSYRSFEEHFFNADFQSRYSRKPLLSSSNPQTLSRRSSLILQLSSPFTVLPVQSVTPGVSTLIAT